MGLKKIKGSIFGKRFNIWDIVFIIAVLGSGWWVWQTYDGWKGFIDQLALTIFSGIIISWIFTFLMRRQRR